MNNAVKQREHDMLRLHGRECPYCGKAMTFDKRHKAGHAYATRDHIQAIARGGPKGKHATIRVCRQCNEDKFMLTLQEYRAVLCVRHRRLYVFAFERKIPSLLVGIAWRFAATTLTRLFL